MVLLLDTIYVHFGEGNGSPLQYSCLANPMDRGAWQAAVHWVAKESDTTERLLSLFTFMHWRRKWQPTPVFSPGESQGQRSLVGCRLWGHTESDMTEATQQHVHFSSAFKFLSEGTKLTARRFSDSVIQSLQNLVYKHRNKGINTSSEIPSTEEPLVCSK